MANVAIDVLDCSRIAIRQMAYWVLASHPDNFRVLDSVLERDEGWWLTSGRPLAAGDRVAIWKYKGHEQKRGVIAFGEVTTDPAVMELRYEDDPYWLGRGRPLRAVAPRIRVRYVRSRVLPLWVDEHPDSVVHRLSVARAQGGTAFRVTDDQWARLLEEAGGWPSSDSPAEAGAISDLVGLIRPRGKSQAFGLDVARRRAVELRAVAVVEAYFADRGWAVTDVSATAPYDLLCRRNDEVLRVEVKGTIGAATAVLLTKNEVTAARADPSSAVLAVVHGISLRQDARDPRGLGGELVLVRPWEIKDDDLEPLAFRYIVPSNSGQQGWLD